MHCSPSPQSSLGRQSKVIEQICQRLTDVCSDDHTREADEQDTTRQVVQVVTALGHAFTKLVDLMISREIKVTGNLGLNLTQLFGFHSRMTVISHAYI